MLIFADTGKVLHKIHWIVMKLLWLFYHYMKAPGKAVSSPSPVGVNINNLLLSFSFW